MQDITRTDGVAYVQVRGMTCDHCVRRVAESLLGVEGVDDAEVDLESGQARVLLNQGDPASNEDLIQAVREAGYEAEHVERPVVPGR